MQAAAVVGADNASMATMDAHAVLDLLSLQPQPPGAAATGSATGTHAHCQSHWGSAAPCFGIGCL